LPCSETASTNGMALGKSGTLHKRKGGDPSQHTDEGDDDEFLDSLSSGARTKRRWCAFILVLVFVNLLLGYVHMQKRSKTKVSSMGKVLTDESFADHIASHPNGTLVNFFSSSCKYCAKLAPEFDEAAKQLQQKSDVSLVSVNAGQAPLAVEQYSVTKFPTLLWFRRGRLVRDVAPSVRTTTKILEFVEESLQPSVIDFASHADFDEAVPQLRSVLSNVKTLPVVVGFGREPAVYKVLAEIGEKFRGLTAFLFVKEAQEGDPFMRVYFRESDADKEYNGDLNVDDVQKWLQPLMDRKEKEKDPS